MIHPLGIYQNTEISRFQGDAVVLGESSAADVDGNRNFGAIGGGAVVDQILYLQTKKIPRTSQSMVIATQTPKIPIWNTMVSR